MASTNLVWGQGLQAKIEMETTDYVYTTELTAEKDYCFISISQEIDTKEKTLVLTSEEAHKLLIWLRDTLPHTKPANM